MTKLTPYNSGDNWDTHWVLHEEGLNRTGLKERFPNREEVTLLGEIHDDDASYSYDDWALCEYQGRYYMFNTSGCSCPSPSETYELAYEGDTIDQLRKAMMDNASEWGVPKNQWMDFEKLFAQVKGE